MRTPTAPLRLVKPRSLRGALAALRDDPALRPLAGGTDIYVEMNFGTLRDSAFLDLWSLEPLRRITTSGDMLSIGALASYADVIRSRLVRRWLPMLVHAARQVGGLQIQNRGTIGGNVANASPAGDTLPVLAAADATVVLRSAAAERRVRFSDFYTGYRASVRRPDELVVALEVPALIGAQWFHKVGTRAAQAISKVVMAGVADASPRIAIGSVAPTVVRLPRTEAALAAGASPEEAARVLGEEIRPIDDVRSTAEYRREVSQNLLRRFLAETAPPPAL
jgi:xanthine dehydrogenase small subunit